MAGVGVFSGGLDEVVGIVDGGNRKIFFFIYLYIAGIIPFFQLSEIPKRGENLDTYRSTQGCFWGSSNKF